MLDAHLAALTLRADTRASLSGRASVLVLVVHSLGLGALWRLLNQSPWLGMPTLAALVAVPLVATHGALRRVVPTLAPLFFLYAVLLARYIVVRGVNLPVPYQDESTLANVRVLAFQIELGAVAAVAYILLIQIAQFARRALLAVPLGVGVAALMWFVVETLLHRTHGVTGTDPYAYVQMAVDFVERGTFLHAFPLFDEVKNLTIPWYPIQHIGYRLFESATGEAATVWPWGGSLWLAWWYSLLGETGLYLATPLGGILALVACAWLAYECARDQNVIVRVTVTALTVVLLATSWEQVDRTLVPLVDVQAQLFSVLAIGLTLRGTRAARYTGWAILAGGALGLAYLVRHTQVLLAVPMVFAAWRMRVRWPFLGLAALTALLVALPDLWYHRINFGHWFVPESHELALFALTSVAKSVPVVAERFLAGNEFGYLFGFTLYGAYRLARTHTHTFGVLAMWLGVLGVFHLFYEALRMRDLLPEFPVLALFTAFGIVSLARDLRERRSMVGDLLAALIVFLALLLFLTRTQFTLARVVQPAKVTFGYVTAAQRDSFAQLGVLTPAHAVIGSTMNDGAIDLYTRRATFRPTAWSDNELIEFIATMRAAGRPLYLLDDGAETSRARRVLAQHYQLRAVATLDVPLFSIVDGTPGVLWAID